MSNFIELPLNFNGIKVFARVDNDGLTRYICLEEDPEYQLWLTEQNN